MKTLPNIEACQRNGNIHIKVSGKFDQEKAIALNLTIQEKYQGRGNVFFHTENISRVLPCGRDYFKYKANRCGLPLKTLFLIGETGRDIMPNGSMVLIIPKKKKGSCCGGTKKKCIGCTNCSCKKKEA